MIEAEAVADEDDFKLGCCEFGTVHDRMGKGGEFGIAGTAVGSVTFPERTQRPFSGDQSAATGTLGTIREPE